MALYYWTVETRVNLTRDEEAKLVEEAMHKSKENGNDVPRVLPDFLVYKSEKIADVYETLKKNRSKRIKYLLKTKCREAIVSHIREMVASYFLGKKGSTKTSASTTTYFYSMKGLEIHIINQQHTLTDLGVSNMKNLLRFYLTSNSKLPVEVEPDRLILKCGINPIIVSAALWFWRTFSQSINNEPFENVTAFTNFLLEKYGRSMATIPFDLLYYFVYWLPKYRSVGHITYNIYREAQWNGPQNFMSETYFRDHGTTELFFKSMKQAIKTPMYGAFANTLTRRLPIMAAVYQLLDAKRKLDTDTNAQFFINMGEFIKRVENFEKEYGWLE
jgi:hypothetical protein